MPIISAGVDAFLLTSVAIAGTTIYYMQRPASASTLSRRAPLRTALSSFVLLHTLYIIYVLLVTPPANLFERLRIPLSTPSDKIRTLLLLRAGLPEAAPLPPAVEGLLTRLASFDVRTIYVRFGQAVVQNCEYCHTFDEYLMHWLPEPLLAYVREAAVLGLVTIRGSHHERLRKYVVGLLVCAAVVEAYFLATAEVKIPRNGLGVFMWHDNFWTFRQLLFLALPLAVHLLPSIPPSPTPNQTLFGSPSNVAATIQTLDTALARLALLKHTQGAALRQPVLRSASTEWWEKQRLEGEWVRGDESVQRVAEKLGIGLVEGNAANPPEGTLKAGARAVVQALMRGFQAAPGNPTAVPGS